VTTALAVARQTEADWQRVIVDAARLFGWHVEHFRQMIGNPSGFPDLAMWRGDAYLLVELKREGGKPRPSQVRWADEAARCGVVVHLWQPSDFEMAMATLRGEG
jgi:hypothetical protein